MRSKHSTATSLAGRMFMLAERKKKKRRN